MSDDPLKLTLKQANPIEKQATWDDPEICSSPMAFLAFLVEHVSVDGKKIDSLSNSVVFSARQPSDQDNKKIWVKTSSPHGIGYFAGGRWRISYEYPPYAIMQLPSGLTVPSFVTVLSESDAEARGLSKDYKWGIFNP